MKPAKDDGGSRLLAPAILALAAVVRFNELGQSSVWVDEGFTWTTARGTVAQLIHICATQDATPPLSYLLTSFALRLGDSEAMLRLSSALASIGLVWLTYRIARLFATRGEAASAAALVALSPFQVMYAQEARSYTPVAFFLVATTYFFLRASLKGRGRDWVFYSVALLAGLYTQSIIALGLVIQLGLIVFVPATRRGFKAWVSATIVAGALYVPWAVLAAAQTRHLAGSHWYLEKPGPREVFHVLRGIAIAPIPLVTAPDGAPRPGLEAIMPRALAQVLLFALPGVPALLGAFRALGSNARGTLARVGLIGIALPLGLITAASLVLPLLLPRFFVFESPFLCLLTAAGLAAFKPRRLGTLWLALLLLLGAYAIGRYDTDYTKERWREAVRAIDLNGLAGRKAALVMFDNDPFFFYNHRLASPMPMFEYSHPSVPFSQAFTPEQLREMKDEAMLRTQDYDEVWVLMRGPGSATRKQALNEAREVAGQGRHLIADWIWESTGGPVQATCWRR